MIPLGMFRGTFVGVMIAAVVSTAAASLHADDLQVISTRGRAVVGDNGPEKLDAPAVELRVSPDSPDAPPRALDDVPARPITPSKPTASTETVNKESTPKGKPVKEPAILEIKEPKSEKRVEKPKDAEEAKQEKPVVKTKEPVLATESKTAKDEGRGRLGKKGIPATQATPTEAPPKHPDTPKPTEAPNPNESPVGHPLAAGIMQLLRDEMISAIKTRGISDNFVRFQRYAGYKLDASSAAYTGSELTGNCRLSWYDHLLRHPLDAPAEAEAFTRNLHTILRDDSGRLSRVIPIIADKLDLPKREPRPDVVVHSPQEALEVVKQALVEAQTAYAAALMPLAKSEIRELTGYLYPVLVSQNNVGHTLADRASGRRLCDLIERMDRNALINAADALVPLTDVRILQQLKQYPDTGSVRVEGVTGHVVAKINTPAGAIVIGGKEPNVYQLDVMKDVAAVIDLGGENAFYEGTTSLDRPVLIVLALGGNNVYKASKPGVQGAAILGVSMVVNLEGGNQYQAGDVAQGSAIAGVGILVDFGGKNRYRGLRRVQGQALGGVGIVIGHGRENDYHAAMWAQGFGAPLGFALVDNLGGYDHYYCGGLYPNSYKPETPGYEGCGQGVGAGIRQVANGGIGVLLNGGGHNVYEFDYLSHGGGYWCAVGFARDFGPGNQYLICRKAFYGGERTERSFQRFGCGWGCHYALGFCFGDGGDDTYEGTIMGSGMAWDCSVGVLCNFGPKIHCGATGGMTQGCGAQGSLGILYHYGDESVYDGEYQGYASPTISYHKPADCGGNFSFLVNYGANNSFGCGAEEYSYNERGAPGGFLISRPRQDQADATAKTPGDKTTAAREP